MSSYIYIKIQNNAWHVVPTMNRNYSYEYISSLLPWFCRNNSSKATIHGVIINKIGKIDST